MAGILAIALVFVMILAVVGCKEEEESNPFYSIYFTFSTFSILPFILFILYLLYSNYFTFSTKYDSFCQL